MSGPLADLTAALFACVARGCPLAHGELVARCAGLTLSVTAGEEVVAVRVGPRGPRVEAVTGAPAVRVEASLAVIRDLIAGDDDVDLAARGDRLGVYGAPEDLVRADEFVRLLVAGAARAPGAGRLFDEFLGMTRGEDHGDG